MAHTDVPDNDFTAMFRTLADDPDAYLRKDAATFASAVGRSFYTQILPSNSVNLGWSSWAIQWLSRTPAPIPDHVQVAYSSDEAVRAAYAKQAAHDWHEFIAFRGRELCPGGRLVVMTVGRDEEGEFGFRRLLSALVDTLDELAAGELLSEDEVHRMCIPTVARTELTSWPRSHRRGGSSNSKSSISRCSTPKTGSGRSIKPTGTQRLSARSGRPSCGHRCSRRWQARSRVVSPTPVGAVLQSAGGWSCDADGRGAGADADSAGPAGAGEAAEEAVISRRCDRERCCGSSAAAPR